MGQSIFSVKEGNSSASKKWNVITEKNELRGHLDVFDLRPLRKGLAVQIGDRWGILNADYQPVVTPSYDLLLDAGRFYFGKTGQGWWLINTHGRTLNTNPYTNVASLGALFATQNGRYWGGLDSTGAVFIPCIYDSLGMPNQHHMVVKYQGKYGIIKLTGEWVIRPQPHPISWVASSSLFRLSIPPFTILKNLKGKTVFVSVYPLRYQAHHFTEIIPYQRQRTYSYKGKLLWVDKDLRVLIKNRGYTFVGSSSEGLQAIKKEGKYGFVDRRGQLRIAYRYDDVRPFKEGLAPVKIGLFWGFLNRLDKLTIQPIYDSVSCMKNNLAQVWHKGKCGLVNPSGEKIIQVKYDQIERLDDGSFILKTSNRVGYASRSGRLILLPRYDVIKKISPDYLLISKQGRWGVITTTGLPLIPFVYGRIRYDPNVRIFYGWTF